MMALANLLSSALLVVAIRSFVCRLAARLLLVTTAFFLLTSAAFALLPAGTEIKAQAFATFTDSSTITTGTQFSNIAIATIQPVEQLSLASDNTLQRPALSTVSFPHVLTNTGNITSTYRFTIDRNGCAGASTGFSAFSLYVDANGNGIADSTERRLTLDSAVALTLPQGDFANLLLLATVPNLADGSEVCARLLVKADTNALSNATASNKDTVTLTSNAAVTLRKAASYNGELLAGISIIDYTLTAQNIGNSAATIAPQASDGLILQNILVDGVPQSLMLVRDSIPQGLEYVPGSLSTFLVGAKRLFRYPGDAAFSYRSANAPSGGVPAAHDRTDAIEIAIGLPAGLPSNATFSMGFKAKVLSNAPRTISNQASAHFFDGSKNSTELSNVSVVHTNTAVLGLAKASLGSFANTSGGGSPDGTATVRFQLLVRNYGTSTLYNVNISDVLENAADGLGSYTTATVPTGAGQYTVVANSLRIVAQNNVGTSGTLATDFTGQAAHSRLFASGGSLPPGASYTLQFDVRYNFAGLPETLFNTANATAGTSPGAISGVAAPSVNGTNPDAAGDGNPAAHGSRTPYSTKLPALNLVKTMSPPRIVAGSVGQYDIDMALRVTNVGNNDAPEIRLMDSLTCAFPLGAGDAFSAWTIQSPPRSLNNLLVPASSFTGIEGTCNQAAIASTDPVASFPSLTSLSVVDSTRGLRVGQSDTISFTVRYTVKSAAIGNVITVTNKAWAGVIEQVNGTPTLTAATSFKVSQSAVDPSGVVYNSVTRQPVAGATVRMTRISCQASAVTPIRATELFGDTSIYTFNEPDNSVTMVTDASGSYAFVLKVPPVSDLCTYRLHVVPPSSSGLVFPSSLITPQQLTYSQCGAVTNITGAPQANQNTTYFYLVQAGKNTAQNSVCEVTNNNIPLDPFAGNALTLQKTSSSKTAEIGDLLTFSLKASNVSSISLPQLSIKDQLPVGFRYVKGSSRVAGVRVADPQGGTGPTLVYNLPVTPLAPLEIGQSITVSYQVRIGVGTPIGEDSINRAWASSGSGASTVTSNEANARIRVLGGVFANEAYAFGKVFMDCNKNGIQDDAELGIPGVRLFMEDGTGILTDLEGKWSLYGLSPVTHALRLDTSSLPPGARLALIEPRQSGQADSLFLDLKKGEWHRANFAVQNCESPGLLNAIEARRLAIVEQPASEGEAARAGARLPTDSRISAPTDVRGLPSAGSIDSSGALKPVTTISSPLIGLPGSATNSDFGPLVASTNPTIPSGLPAASSATSDLTGSALTSLPKGNEDIPLEESLQGLDYKLAFLNLSDQQLLTSTTSHVRVKGRLGSRLVLKVNGVVVPEDRVGKRARLEGQQLEAWEYIAVQFRVGTNTVELNEVDGFGIARGTSQIEVRAPGALTKIVIEVPSTAKADERSVVTAKIRLVDANGLTVNDRTALTLESIAARWNVTDVNPLEPGVQVMVQGGAASFELIPPANPGDGKVRVSAGAVQSEARIIFLPDLRPLTGIGVLEGVLNLRNPGNMPLGAPSAADAFETELRGWSDQNGDTKGSARAAFYFKGVVKGEYLLTAAYDSDKTSTATLFRDIQPDQFYPIYGDSATKTFDAQSSQRFYLRIDKNRSYLLFGDFNTASSPEVRKLSQVSRTNTGLQHVYNSENTRVTTHYSRDALKQVIEEIPANGTSGPFILNNSSGSDLLANGETVEVIVRDRNQPNVVLSSFPLTRFVDYSIEPLSKRLLLTRPLSSLDTNLNPQSIRINYVVDTNGPAFDVAGVDVQLRVSDRLQVGAVAEYDGTPDNQRKLGAATALARLDDKTVLKGEVVATRTDLKGDGQAIGLELRRDDALLKYNLTVQTSDARFDNPSAGLVSGHSEVRGHLDYKLSEESNLKAELVYTQDNGLATGQGTSNLVQTQGVSVSIQNKITPNVTGEFGLRAGQTDTSAATGFDYGSVSAGTAATTAPVAASGTTRDTLAVRARLTVAVPKLPNAQVFAEAEQDVYDNNRHIAAIGGNYALTDKARVYGRYEVISSLGSEYALTNGVQRNVGLIGVESAYMQGGRIYDEYRIADTIDGRALQSAMGVRNTFEVTEGFKLTGSLEQVSALPGVTGTSSGASTALTSGFDWLGTGAYRGRVRGSGSVELREGADANSGLVALGLAYKLNADWSLLTRATLNRVTSHSTSSDHWLEREQIGFAYRPVGQDVWNSLFRYEHKADITNGDASSTQLSVNTLTDILSAHVNYQLRKRDVVSGRFAAKQNVTTSDGLRSSYGAQLLYARWTHDINQDWDFGLQAGLLLGDGNAQQHALGAEVGYQLNQGLWVSAGYNVIGLHDPDLTGADYTDSGFYLRLRFKFDERLFKSGALADAGVQ